MPLFLVCGPLLELRRQRCAAYEHPEPLEHPDNFHLQSAQGWLELGSHIEANEELEKITAQLRAHPDVLKVRWRVYAKAKRWDACLEIARAPTELEPDKPGGWIDYAQSLHRLNRTSEAYDLLATEPSRFLEQPIILYHLAVYGCHLHRLWEAWTWLERAFEIGDPAQIKMKALDDPDLEPLGAEI
jgi:predicted Zn-dependent protease